MNVRRPLLAALAVVSCAAGLGLGAERATAPTADRAVAEPAAATTGTAATAGTTATTGTTRGTADVAPPVPTGAVTAAAATAAVRRTGSAAASARPATLAATTTRPAARTAPSAVRTTAAAPATTAARTTTAARAATVARTTTAARTATAPRATAAASGPAAGRTLVWHDEFTGARGSAPSAARWVHETGGLGWGDGELQAYTASTRNVGLDGSGHLAVTARREAGAGGAHYTSGRISTDGTFSFTHGLVEFRAKLPKGQGLWPALWTLGDYDRYGWPGCGEIDVMEAINSMRYVAFHTHQATTGGNDWAFGVDSAQGDWSTAWHTFAVDWQPTYLRWYVDGKLVGTQQKIQRPAEVPWAFGGTRPQHLLINLAVGGSWPGAPSAATRFPATMLVDYVRVYR